MVATLQQELQALQPVLQEKTAQTETLLLQVAQDTEEADRVSVAFSHAKETICCVTSCLAKQVRVKVAMEEEEVSKQAAAVATLQADAQRDLDRALPALQAAERALDSLSKADITEVKVIFQSVYDAWPRDHC